MPVSSFMYDALVKTIKHQCILGSFDFHVKQIFMGCDILRHICPVWHSPLKIAK